jgi:hypothetical protein
MGDCNPTKIPMNPGLRLHEDKSGEPVDETEYKKMVGCLRYLLHTRPDMAFFYGGG